jgi:hypothetical protein
MATNAKRKIRNRTRTSITEIGDDLVIARKSRRSGVPGTWVTGTLNGHRFQALVFSEHAENPDYELDRSRISKLWLQRLANHYVVANFDRGWDIPPLTKRAQAIVDFLAAGLAEHIYGE